MQGMKYAGDVGPNKAWETISTDPKARIVDVRTAAEWTFVGVPDLSSKGGEVLRVEWQTLPSMQLNPEFVRQTSAALESSGAGPDTPIFFLCRSGARSASAAAAMTAAGYENCFNIAGGFEGPRDENGHRGTAEGWKAEGLPWVQS